MKCGICGHGEHSIAYYGRIRVGRYPNTTDGSETVYECGQCAVQFLALSLAPDVYETGAYRESVGESDISSHWRFISQVLDPETISGLNVLDIGSGPGEFLDYCKQYAALCYAVEPDNTIEYGDDVERSFSTSEIPEEYLGKFEVITCFSVIEHVEDPIKLLAEARPYLSANGVLILSTPNRTDINMALLSETYPQFFYRIAHKYYFHDESLAFVGEHAGYDDIKICHFQRFGLDNELVWARDKAPGMGQVVLPGNTDGVEQAWIQYLEANGISDYLYMMMKTRGEDH